MPLDKDILGTALYNRAQNFNDVDVADIDQARRNFWNGIAEEIVNHIKSNASLTVPGAGLVAPSGGGAVTGASTTGTIQ